MSEPTGPDRGHQDPSRGPGDVPPAATLVAVIVFLLVLGWVLLSNLRPGGPGQGEAKHVASPATPMATVAGTEASLPRSPDVHSSAPANLRAHHPARTSGPKTGSRPSPNLAAELAGCRRVVAEQDVALGSAAVAVDRWQIQVGAMNKFEVGAISLHRLLVFWERTRPEADRRRDTFDAVTGPLRAPSSSCPSVARGASAQLRVCIVDAASRQAALGAARTAVDDWVAHEGRIGDVSAGRLSGAALKSHWLRTWRTVVRDLVDYHRAVRQLNGGSSCTV